MPGDGDAQFSYAALCSDGEVRRVARRPAHAPVPDGLRARAAATSRRSTTRASSATPGGCSRAMRLHAAWSRSSSSATRRTGANLLLDVNPRAWGWQSLCGRAGRRLPLPALADWRAGEAVAAGARGARGPLGPHRRPTCSRSPASSAAGRLSARDYLRSLRRPLEFAVFARDDPLPVAGRPARHGRALVAGRLIAGRPV